MGSMGMGVLTRAKKRRQQEEERLVDRISSLPDGVLGDIVSLLPTKDGARTQVLSSRWRHLWRSAPLNLDLQNMSIPVISVSTLSGILSAHPGPGRRFAMRGRRFTEDFYRPAAATLDGWLRSPTLDGLQELELRHVYPLMPWIRRFSSTLRVATFTDCSFSPLDGNNIAGSRPCLLPVLQQMTLLNVGPLERYLHILLAGCPILESLLIDEFVHPRLQIVSRSLRSIGLRFSKIGQSHPHKVTLVIEDAPCLERLLYLGGIRLDVSIVSAPRLVIWGDLFCSYYGYSRETTFFQGSTVASMTAVLPTVRVLSLAHVEICLDAAINLVKCFPRLESLYIKAQTTASLKDVSYLKCQKVIATLDVRVRKIVMANYKGKRPHVNFVKLFVSNSIVLESIRLELGDYVSHEWKARQHDLLHIHKRASRGAQIDFISPFTFNQRDDLLVAKHVHDLSTDPFQRFH